MRGGPWRTLPNSLGSEAALGPGSSPSQLSHAACTIWELTPPVGVYLELCGRTEASNIWVMVMICPKVFWRTHFVPEHFGPLPIQMDFSRLPTVHESNLNPSVVHVVLLILFQFMWSCGNSHVSVAIWTTFC